jgi:hypothetical protein
LRFAEGDELAAFDAGRSGERMNSETGGGLTRRRFLGGAAAAAATGAMTGAVPRAGAAAVADENPWRYDVDRLRQVDPAMIGYERVGGFAVASPGVRRLVWARPRELWVTAGKSLLAYDLGGAKVAEVAVGDVVRCLAVAPDGRLIVGLRDRVEIYDREGQRLARWPAVSGKPFLTGLALGNDMVFVADSGNRVVYRCDLEGRIQVRIGEKNPARSIPGLVLPSPFLDVEMGGDGLLRVTNPGRHRVEVYTVDGALELAWGRPGVALDAFCGCCNPIAVSLLGDGRVVTAEKGLPRVKVYGATGTWETVVAGPNQFAPVGSDERSQGKPDTALEGLDVAVGPDGRVAVLDLVGSTVQVFQQQGTAAAAA